MALYIRWKALKDGKEKPEFTPASGAANDENFNPVEMDKEEAESIAKEQAQLEQKIEMMKANFEDRETTPFKVEGGALTRLLI
jgi:hypothetical protein